MKINKLFFILLSSLFLGGHLFAANYEAYKTFLKGTFDLKTGHIDDCIKNYEKVTDLDKEAFSVYKNLAYLYWQAGKIDKAFEIAQKIDEIDGSNPKTTSFLAMFYLVANKPAQAWMAYSLSSDFKEDKKIRKKLDSAQKQMLLDELYKQMLLRSESNYLKLFPFKTGFKAKISSSFLSKKFYIPFSYHKNNSVKIDLPAILISGGVSAHIKNGTYEFVPKAIENQLPQEISNIISKTCEFLSDNFYKQFVDAKITQKGNRVIYSKEGKELVLNLDTALIESFFDKDLTVTISKYEKFVISNVPKKIKFAFKNIKIKGLLETTKISPIPYDNQNENNSQSSGKN
ncbi:MAG: hypothetical protein LBT58_04495 [Endomicrobium sp.]|jgi:hypothetical protein|nr:hypothetical protein [Endomicrobium sp.]